ncbi:gluconate 2-dehydrogenase subunit 3 family protein [Robbsia sp. Bb-Pol-6]|uniref:Gluconate 2-dehydrogenase subunit 3 family protein n=1 Tax=Robbsia betulipollinis TaxID=2981849 RepID=A0ABT3ZHW1_9BURK|nr:gluconate 2-dehydrogenase subunit 3 family protein [Robbsia betulipollinis]MCY0386111.1 gluconate 2-dehydrogenase subunit 3 family protein [Robbsia betulipollinis]
MPSSNDSGRRRFLKGSLTIAPLAAGGLSAGLLNAQETPPRDDLAKSAPAIANQPTVEHYQPTFFTPDEWAFLNAAVDRMIPKDDVGPGGVEQGVPQYIDRQMQTPYADGSRWYLQGPFFDVAPEFGYQMKLTPKQQYRLGIRAINDYCRAHYDGKTFVQLDAAQQTDLLKQIEAGKAKSPDFKMGTFFNGFLLVNVMEGYFCDPMYGGNKDMASWKMIGYPGVRADYLEWVPESKPYPYQPISMYGKRG